MRKARVFLRFTPKLHERVAYKRGKDLDPNHTILLPRVLIGAPLTKSTPSWTVDAAPPLALPALSQEIGGDVQSRTASW